MHHPYTHSHLIDLDHSCTDSSLGVGGYGGTSTGMCFGTLPNCKTAATVLKDLEKLVEIRSFLIMWDKHAALLRMPINMAAVAVTINF